MSKKIVCACCCQKEFTPCNCIVHFECVQRERFETGSDTCPRCNKKYILLPLQGRDTVTPAVRHYLVWVVLIYLCIYGCFYGLVYRFSSYELMERFGAATVAFVYFFGAWFILMKERRLSFMYCVFKILTGVAFMNFVELVYANSKKLDEKAARGAFVTRNPVASISN